MSLTNAEKLQAISSPWANYITLLEKTHLTIDGGLIDKISFDDSRGRAFQNTAQLVYCCAGLPAAQRIPTAAKLEKWLTSQDETPSAAFKYAMTDVLGKLWELGGDEELDAPFRAFKAKVSPVEFVYIGTPPPPLLRPLVFRPILKESKKKIGLGRLSSKACCCTLCAKDTAQPNNHALHSSSDATSVKPTSTCASTRAWPPIAGASSMQSRTAKYPSSRHRPLRPRPLHRSMVAPRPMGSVSP